MLCGRLVVNPGIFPDGTRLIGTFSSAVEASESIPLTGLEVEAGSICDTLSCSTVIDGDRFRALGNVVAATKSDFS